MPSGRAVRRVRSAIGSLSAPIDLSHPIDAATPPFPGDPPVEVRILDASSVRTPDGRRHVNLSQVVLGLHVGTHMDAPYHFVDSAATIDQVALDACIGPCALVDLPGFDRGGAIESRHLEPHGERLRAARRAILRTGWEKRWKTPGYFEEHPVLSKGAARFLVDSGLLLVGADMPSVDRPPHEAHLELLGRGIVIVENLTNLGALPEAPFWIAALPLRVAGRDGSPVRAVAFPGAEPGP